MNMFCLIQNITIWTCNQYMNYQWDIWLFKNEFFLFQGIFSICNTFHLEPAVFQGPGSHVACDYHIGPCSISSEIISID